MDEEGWDFCVRVCVFERRCASFGTWLRLHKTSGDRGENWTGITVPQCRVPVTHGETLPVLKESDKDARCTGGAGGDGGRDNSPISQKKSFSHFFTWHIIERWDWPSNCIETHHSHMTPMK